MEFCIFLLLSIALIAIYFNEMCINVCIDKTVVCRLHFPGLHLGCWGVNKILHTQITSLCEKKTRSIIMASQNILLNIKELEQIFCWNKIVILKKELRLYLYVKTKLTSLALRPSNFSNVSFLLIFYENI